MIARPRKSDSQIGSHLGALLASPRCAPMERAAERVFLERAQAGDRRAVERLVMANMKFVAAVARNFQNQGLSMPDLVQEGAMGLQRAIEKFDMAATYKGKPVRLISYGVWWIRQRIITALADHARSMKTPQRLNELSVRADRARRKLEQKLGRRVDIEEIVKEMEIRLEALQEAEAALVVFDSLDAPAGDEACRLDFVASEETADGAHEESELNRNLSILLRNLDPDDREILLRYFGVKAGEGETLAQIAERMGLSRERVRQRLEKALAKSLPRARRMGLFTPTKRGA